MWPPLPKLADGLARWPMYHAITTSTPIESHESAKFPGYESATRTSRRKIAPTFAGFSPSGASAAIIARHLLEHVDRLGIDGTKLARRGAAPRHRAHERAERRPAGLELDVQVDAALGAHDAQLAQAGDRPRAREQLVVDVIERDAIPDDRVQLRVELARRPERDDAPAVDDRDAVAQLPRLVEEVGREDDGLAGLFDQPPADQRADLFRVDRIDGARRLVEEHDAGVGEQRARDREPHASRTRSRRRRCRGARACRRARCTRRCAAAASRPTAPSARRRTRGS